MHPMAVAINVLALLAADVVAAPAICYANLAAQKRPNAMSALARKLSSDAQRVAPQVSL